jgi:penicillin-binding protein 1A
MKKLFKFLFFILVIVILFNVYVEAANKSKYSIDKNLKKQVSDDVENYVTLGEIPENLKVAIVAVEDRRFYYHPGFDPIALVRASMVNLKEGRYKQGGSTITQQLSKNLFLSSKKTMDRKLKELAFAIKLETLYSKEDILEMYLNVIYFGDGAYGVQNASRKFFNKDVSKLSKEESALLAGLPQAPSIYNPNDSIKNAKRRQTEVLKILDNKEKKHKIKGRIMDVIAISQ